MPSKLTLRLLEILEEDIRFNMVFGNKDKVSNDADLVIETALYSYYNAEEDPKVDLNDVQMEDIAGFMLYEKVDNIKEYRAYSFQDHSDNDYRLVLASLIGNRIHVVSNSEKVKAFLNAGATIKKTYTNYLEEPMVLLDFTHVGDPIYK